jgi:hypothetical protein
MMRALCVESELSRSSVIKMKLLSGDVQLLDQYALAGVTERYASVMMSMLHVPNNMSNGW